MQNQLYAFKSSYLLDFHCKCRTLLFLFFTFFNAEVNLIFYCEQQQATDALLKY